MRFLCLGYIDEEHWKGLPEGERQQRIESCKAYDEVLKDGGHFAGGQCLDSATKAVTLKATNGKIEASDGPFAETKEVIGGILHLEARDMEHAVELMKAHPGVAVGPFEIRPLTPDSARSDEEQIRAVVAGWSRALEAKDLDALMQNYLPEAVLYDCIPPYKVEGKDAIRACWENCLPCFPEKFRSQHRDLQVVVSGEVAVVFGLHHFVPEPADHPCGQSWMRISVTFRKVAGAWKVAHEHVSVPWNPMNDTVWKIKDPAVLDHPDYSAQPCEV